MEQVPGITRPVSTPSSLKKAPLSSPEKKKNGKTSTKEQSSTRHLPSKAKRRRTSLLLTSSGSSPSKTKLEMKLEKNVAKRKSEDGTTTSISINQQPKRPASSVYSQLPFPFLTKKWYRSQVFTQDDGKPTTPPAASNTKTDRNIIESEEILPFTMLSRDWYSTQTMSMNNYSEPVTQETSREKNNIIPLPSMSQLWYKRRGQLAQKNLSRRKCTLVSGTLEENIKNLERDSKNTSMGQTLRERKLSMSNVGKYIIKHGPFVPTQEIGKFMKENKTNFENDPKGRRQMSSEIYKNVSSYLNLMQIYVKGTAYLLENKDYDLSEVTQRLEDICGKSNTEAVNKHINDNVSELLKTAIRFADTKRDADLIKGLFAKTTSVKHVAKMLNVQNRSSIRSAEQQLKNKLFEFQNLECASQVVRNDMTNEQQRRLTKRIIAQRKQKEFKLQFETRGRALKADLFPELKLVLEEIFSHGTSGMLGGLESHPRLTTDIMYRSRDNTLYMRQAREILLKVVPPGFGISLKSCYNYTESYKEKTYSAKRHHAGKDVNARISLKCPPRTNVSKHVVNLHWTTKNVNLLLESTVRCESNCLVDSKDAKTIICGDIQPVQYPGKSWKPISYEDHTFDQSRTNAVYPMTHLFLDNTPNSHKSIKDDPNTIHLTRTGRPALLINLAYFEPETTFRAMNELLYLLTQPSLDNVFRNSVTGKLKCIFAFLVDNGHGEDPDSPLTQMCLARILHMFSLTKISQRSFAEYHSKRNFVERVHASENSALSRHGCFRSKQVHPNAETGSKEHIENMDKMAEDVKDCLSQARFAGKFLECFRGIGENGIFSDEVRLKEFLRFSEERKDECEWTYSPKSSDHPHFQALVNAWGVPEDFERSYIEDYQVIMNKTDRRTAWKDKYSTNLYGTDNEDNFELQPIPDYVSWLTSGGELHYLSFEKTAALYSSEILDSPELFLPSRILNNFFIINPNPPDDVLHTLALLCWIPTNDVKTHFKNKCEKMENEYKQDILREKWKDHKLYTKSSADLQQMCKKKGLSAKGIKHELVRRVALHDGEKEGNTFQPSYNGDISSLPQSIGDLKKLPIATLKHILKSHALSICGKKDDLVLRVFLLKHGRSSVA